MCFGRSNRAIMCVKAYLPGKLVDNKRSKWLLGRTSVVDGQTVHHLVKVSVSLRVKFRVRARDTNFPFTGQ